MVNPNPKKLPSTIELPTKQVGSSLQEENHPLHIPVTPLDPHQAQVSTSFKEDSTTPWSPLMDELRGDGSSPFSQKKERGWKGMIVEYLENHGEGFVQRIEKLNLTENDLNILSKTLELSARDGDTYDKYLGAWRILSSEYISIAQKYPQMARSSQVAKTLRKAFIHETAAARLNNSPGTALKALEHEDLLGDDYLKKADEFDTMELHKKIELRLHEMGVIPCQYAQVVYYHGDLPDQHHEAMDDDFKAFGLSEEKIAQLLGINP